VFGSRRGSVEGGGDGEGAAVLPFTMARTHVPTALPSLLSALAGAWIAAAPALAGPPPPCYSLTYTGLLVAPDAAADDQLGASIACWGDVVVVGAPLDDDGRAGNAGSVYIWTRSGDAWLFTQKLTAADGAAEDRFGQAVAAGDGVILVGAPFADADAANTGGVYVFTHTAGVWTQSARLVASDRAAGDRFGSAIALAGDLAVIGAPFDEAPGQVDRGAAYVFTRSGGTWTQQQKLIASNAVNNDQFGSRVAVGGARIGVGAPLHDAPGMTDAGAVYIFENSGGSWNEVQVVTPATPAQGANFGSGLALSADLLGVGAERGLVGDARVGTAYVFGRSGSGWTQRQRLLAPGGHFDDHFGACVAVADGAVLVGAPNADTPFVPHAGVGFLFTPDGTQWALELRFSAPKPGWGMAFGSALAAPGGGAGIAFFGAPLDNAGDAADAGTAHVFDYVTQPPVVTDQPDAVRLCAPANVTFSIAWRDEESPTFRWRRDGVPIDDGPAPGSGSFFGTQTPVLSIEGADTADRALYDVVVTNSCGPTTSTAAPLLVCPADWTCDGVTNSTDVSEFVNAWFEDLAHGTLRTDVDASHVVDSADVTEFLNRWFDDVGAGC
jgi:hypothetical protein